MTRVDDLFSRERNRTQQLEVSGPPFERLRARGVRRRARRRAATVGAAVVLVAGIALGGQVLEPGGDGRRDPVATPAPSPTPAPAPPTTSASENPRRGPQLVSMAISLVDPNVRAALWQRCTRRCQGGAWELLLTRDGFDTEPFRLPVSGEWAPVLTPLGGEAFHVATDTEPGSMVVRADGTSAQVTLADEPGPVAAGEVLVTSASIGGRFVALDPVTAAAHPVSLPDGHSDVLAQPDGSLLGWSWSQREGSRAFWSADSGRTWQQKRLVAGGRAMVWVLFSAQAGTMAVVEGSDAQEGPGGVDFPLARVHRSTDGGRTWETFQLPRAPQGYFLGWGGVMPDGRLVLDVVGWGDEPEERALHVSDGADWSSFAVTHTHLDGTSPAGLTMVATQAGLEIRSVDGTAVEVSTDAGVTWERYAGR